MQIESLPTFAFRVGHIFISFTHEDREIVDRIVSRLQQSEIPVWTDYKNLKVGTPDWESSIREALNDSQIILLAASPASRLSPFVKSELALARALDRPIFPLWIVGDEWIESVPLGFATIQHADCRGENFDDGLVSVIEMVQSSINESCPNTYIHEEFRSVAIENSMHFVSRGSVPPQYVSIELSEYSGQLASEKAFVFKEGAFASIRDLLDCLYINALHERFPQFTYGAQWLLLQSEPGSCRHSIGIPYIGRRSPCRMVLPWSALQDEVVNDEHIMRQWKVETKPEAQGIRAGTNWCVAAAESISAFGVAVQDPRVFFQLTWGKSSLPFLIDRDYFAVVGSSQNVDLTRFAHTAIIDLESYNEQNRRAKLDFQHGEVLIQLKELSAKDSVWLF